MDGSFRLNDKTVLVTGASSGIGKKIAVRASQAGAKMIITARNNERLEYTKDQLEEGKDHQLILADLKKSEEIISLAEDAPKLNGLVLNAGLVKRMPIKYIDQDSIEEQFQVNVQSSMLLVQQLLRKRKLVNGSSICFISSISSKKNLVGNAIYAATKSAVNSFVQSLALEVAKKKIRANAILPGFIQTNILEDSDVGESQLAQHKKNYPLGRFGTPDDVANLSLYLLSDLSEWMTGSLLKIDGGFSLK